jgi:hypothetical protein
MRQPDTGSSLRPSAMPTASALCTRFPPRAGDLRRPTRLSVPETLRARFPQLLSLSGCYQVPSSAGRPARPLPQRRACSVPVPSRQTQPPSLEVLQRVLAGLQRL